MIPPRGCAYVCMVHRQDAFRALQKLSSGSYKIGSKVIKVRFGGVELGVGGAVFLMSVMLKSEFFTKGSQALLLDY